MKRLLLLTGFVFGLMAFSYQSSDITGVVNAFKSADATQIGAFLTNMWILNCWIRVK